MLQLHSPGPLWALPLVLPLFKELLLVPHLKIVSPLQTSSSYTTPHQYQVQTFPTLFHFLFLIHQALSKLLLLLGSPILVFNGIIRPKKVCVSIQFTHLQSKLDRLRRSNPLPLSTLRSTLATSGHNQHFLAHSRLFRSVTCRPYPSHQQLQVDLSALR